MSLPDGFVVESTPQNALPDGFEIDSVPQSGSALAENARMLASAPVRALDAIPEMGNSVLSGLAWAGQKIGIGDGTYTPAETFSELEPGWMKPQTEYGNIGANVGGMLLGAPDAPLVAGRVAKRGAEMLAEKAIPAASKELMDIAQRLGFKPTMAVVTQSAPVKITEQVLANTPFSAGVTRDAVAEEREGLEAAYGKMAGDAPDSSQLGYDIQEQVKDSIQTMQDAVGVLYDRAFNGVSGKMDAPIPATKKQIKSIVEKFSGNPVLDELFGSKAAGKLKQLKSMTMNELRNTRSKVGQAIGEGNVAKLKDISEGDLRQLYGALSEDIKSALRRARPSSAKMWEEADEAYAKSIEKKQEMTGKFLTGKDSTGTYNAVFGASDKGFKPISKETALTLRETLSPEVWDDVKQEFLRRMGKATSANGNEFSPATFATNWGKVEDAIKAEVFTPAEAKDLEDIATYSKAVREMEKSRNYSNTAHVLAFSQLPGAIYTAPVTTTLTIAGAGALSRVMASAKMMDWMASVVANGEMTPELAKGLELILRGSLPERLALMGVGKSSSDSDLDPQPEVRITIDKGYNDKK